MTSEASWSWLASTVDLQKAYGYELPLTDADALADYLTFNLLALHLEVSEVAREIDWKPWSTGRGTVNRDALCEEIVDVLHFIANIACSVGISDATLWDQYRAKQEVNRHRLATGYAARVGSTPVEEGPFTPTTYTTGSEWSLGDTDPIFRLRPDELALLPRGTKVTNISGEIFLVGIDELSSETLEGLTAYGLRRTQIEGS